METGEAFEFHMRMAWGYRTQEIKPRCQGDLRMDISGNSAGRILDFSRLWQHGWGGIYFLQGSGEGLILRYSVLWTDSGQLDCLGLE